MRPIDRGGAMFEYLGALLQITFGALVFSLGLAELIRVMLVGRP